MKDFAISREPTQADVLRTKLLGKIIDDHVTDRNIVSTAKRAAWPGNDETHYYRVWEDQDIEDMKVLIELTVRWIVSEQMTRDYEQKMAAKKRNPQIIGSSELKPIRVSFSLSSCNRGGAS